MTVRRLLVVAALAAATTSVAVPPAPAEAGSCEDGVIVVVDASAFDRGTSQTCVPASGKGVDVLAAAGHPWTYVPGNFGMICTIDGRPDPCNYAPTHAYWSYWHAAQGADSWTYSNEGAGTRTAEAGTVEGWSFGSGSPPGIAPPGGEPEPEPEQEPEDEGSSGSSGSEEPPSESPSPPSSSGSAEEPTTERSTEDGDSTAATDDDRDGAIDPAEPAPDVPVDGTAGYRSPVPSDEQDPSDERDDPVTDDRAADDEVALPDRDEGSAPVGLVVGGGLVTGLAALTALQVRRRRLEG